MKKIGPKNSTPELSVRSLIHRLGYRFRLHRKNLPGKPDIVLPKYRKVIFINGCFWHGHNKCKKSKLPETNKKFWQDKIKRNKNNDKKCKSALTKLGWSYIVVWQCEIKKSNIENLEQKLISYIENQATH